MEMDGWMDSKGGGEGGGRMLEKVLIERLILWLEKPDRSITNTHTHTVPLCTDGAESLH